MRYRAPNLLRYPHWEALPAGLMTVTQLRRQGLAPGGPPVACIHQRISHIWCLLYPVDQARPRRRATPAQCAVLARGRATQAQQRAAREEAALAAEYAEIEAEAAEQRADREAATTWAPNTLADEQAVILDLETTGLDDEAEIVQIAVLAMDGRVLLDTLVRPAGPITPEATSVHGLDAAGLVGAPSFPDVYPVLAALLQSRLIVTYNVEFDQCILNQVLRRHRLRRWRCRWGCAMLEYAAWMGEWSDTHQDYRWHPLPGGNHSALGDCRATLALLQRMATTA